MTSRGDRPTALIWVPEEGPGRPDEQADQRYRAAVQTARLHNLVEWLDSQHWTAWYQVIGTWPSQWFQKLVWIGREGLDEDVKAAARRLLGGHDLDEVELDWRDIDELVLDASVDLSALGDPNCRRDDEALARLVTRPAETPETSITGAEPPVVIGCGGGLRAVWVARGRRESEALDAWEDLEVVASDPSSTHAVSADGRLVAVLHEGRLGLTWLTVARQGVALVGESREIALPDGLFRDPRLVTAAPMLSGAVRLTVADELGSWWLFVSSGGDLSTVPVSAPPVSVGLGIDVLSTAMLYQADGRPFRSDGGESPFPGLRVSAVDAAFSAGVTVVAAVGTRGRGGDQVLEVRRRLGAAAWETVSVSEELREQAVDVRGISGVSVERRLDERAPSRLVVATGDTPHVLMIPATTDGANEEERRR